MPGSGNGNPPDKYAVVPITGDAAADELAINAKADQGYRFLAVLNHSEILMGGYKGNS